MLKKMIAAVLLGAVCINTPVFPMLDSVAYAKTEKKDKEKAQAYYVSGVDSMKNGDTKTAAANFIEAHKIDGENPLYSLFAGDMLTKLKQYPAAIRSYKDALDTWKKGEKKQRDKIRIKALLGLSDANAKAGNNGEALAYAKQLVEEYPEDYRGPLAMGRIYAKNKETYRDAVDYLNKSIDLNKEQLPAYLSLAAVFNSAGKTAKVIDVYERACDYRPLDEALKMSLAQVYFTYKEGGRNHYNDAIRVLKSILDVNPNNAFAHYYLALGYALTNQSSLADSELAILTQLNKNLADKLYKELVAYNRKMERGETVGEMSTPQDGEVISLDETTDSSNEKVSSMVEKHIAEMERKS